MPTAISSTPEKKKVYIFGTAQGCAVNLTENLIYRNYFKNGQNHEILETPVGADIILINTCAVIETEERRSVELVQKFSAQYPHAEIQIAGCLPKINPSKTKTLGEKKIVSIQEAKDFMTNSKEISAHDFYFNPLDLSRLTLKHKFVFLVRRTLESLFRSRISRPNLLRNILDTAAVNPQYRMVSVGQGCLSKCTFCTIRRAKGRLQSLDFDFLRSQAQGIADAGVKKIWLIGDDIGCWGLDIGRSSPELLKMYLSFSTTEALAIGYFDPTYLIQLQNQVKEVFVDPRISLVNISMQSGSDRILKLMGRNHPPAQVRKILTEIKKTNPSIAFKATFIVGFPSETWMEFFSSLWMSTYFDINHSIPFDGRPGTVAAQMENQIGPVTKQIRNFLFNVFLVARHSFVLMRAILKP